MKNIENPMHSLKDDFLAESAEHLESAEGKLILLEKQTEYPDTELVADILRSVHSIKGAAGFMGYTRLGELTHAMETLLQKIRETDIKSGFIDTLISGIDILRNMLDNLDTSNSLDISQILGRIADLIDSTGASETWKKMKTPVQLTDTQGYDIGFAISEFRLHSIPQDYTFLYLLKYNLHELEKKQGIKTITLIRKLLDKGSIIDTKIETGAVDFDQDLSEVPLMYLILYATSLEPDKLEGISGLGKQGIVEISSRLPAQSDSDTFEPEKPLSQAPPHIPPGSHPEIPLTSRSQEQDAGEIPEAPIGKELQEHTDTVRIRVDVLDRLMKLAGELVLVRNNLLAMTESDQAYQKISRRLNIVTTELQETIIQTRMQPIGNLFSKLPRIVRDLSLKLGRQINISTLGNDVELDKAILESLTDPLIHLIRNCCDHGIEPPDIRKKAGKPSTGSITVHAYHEAGQINIQVKDDGRGIDPSGVREKAVKNGLKTREEISRMSDRDILHLIFIHGFSTAETVSDISGRGIGMDVVRAGIEQTGGTAEIESSPGAGTRIHLRLPLTLAIIPCLIIESDGFRYAIPQVNLNELICLYNQDIYTRIECAGKQEVFRLRNELLPIVRLSEVLSRAEPFTEETRGKITDIYSETAQRVIDGEDPLVKELNFAVVKLGTKRYGLVVDQIIGVEEIVVNPMHNALKPLEIYSGTTVMGDGSVSLILDIEGIARHAAIRFNITEEDIDEKHKTDDEIQTVLLFKNGPHEQFAVPLPMIRRIEHILASRIEKVGDREFVTIAGISTLILRLDKYLNVSPCVENDEMLVLLPKHIRRPVGILVSEVIDTAESSLYLNVESYMEDGFLGSSIIRDHMTLFIDIYRLIELAEPNWFDERKKQAPRPDQRKHILLVEDTVFFRRLVSGYLEADGYEVTTAENGLDAIEAMDKETFDIIVSDLDMPLMDGWTFMEYIRRESSFPDIISLALTALDSDEDRARAEASGFNAYQVKLDREGVLSCVSNLISGKR
ncbi:MAG: hybrid sensor histidine kinase/response regulator [Desulfobacterales bacterium]|nr:hybrid sensor histidine kinase/response regulator [Desulfobacterales bacterium]